MIDQRHVLFGIISIKNTKWIFERKKWGNGNGEVLLLT